MATLQSSKCFNVPINIHQQWFLMQGSACAVHFILLMCQPPFDMTIAICYHQNEFKSQNWSHKQIPVCIYCSLKPEWHFLCQDQGFVFPILKKLESGSTLSFHHVSDNLAQNSFCHVLPINKLIFLWTLEGLPRSKLLLSVASSECIMRKRETNRRKYKLMLCLRSSSKSCSTIYGHNWILKSFRCSHTCKLQMLGGDK